MEPYTAEEGRDIVLDYDTRFAITFTSVVAVGIISTTQADSPSNPEALAAQFGFHLH